MRIWRRRCNWNSAATNGDDDRRIIRRIAERDRFSILNPEIGPIVFNSHSEWRSRNLHIPFEILRDVESLRFSREQNSELALSAILRPGERNFCSVPPA